MSHLGYGDVPEGQRGWNGHWGAIPMQGPRPRPEGYVDPPDPACVVEALVITAWTCHACCADNDVWGEGAVGSWMECGSCGESSYLVM